MLARDRGLVLRTFPLRETSKILSVLSREHGKLRLVARGVRTPKSRAGANLEVGNELEIVFDKKPHRDLGNLRETSLVRGWFAGLGRLESLAVGLGALEILERLVPDGAPESGLLDDAWEYLEALCRITTRPAALLLFYGFELRVMARLGLQPELEACRVCRAAGSGPAWLDVAAAGWVCRACRVPSAHVLTVSHSVVALLGHLAREPWSVEGLDPTPEALRTLGLAIHRLLAAHIESYRYPRSLGLLKTRPPAPAASSEAPSDAPLPEPGSRWGIDS